MSSDVLFTPVAGIDAGRVNGERLWDSLMALAEIGADGRKAAAAV
ncbi:Uncharacterised protein [Raoultella terrigena]|uniref:Beta-ureidopropionase n=1 Tax=Raoultella terrigena TaxID=577 RepID=A0A3P8KIF8_RAOTE|nr:Uncharacterised protein [Raoultella terrigena]